MSRIRTVALGAFALLGVLDIAGLAGFFVDDAPPAWVLLAGGGLGALTLAGVWLAAAGRRGGVATAVATRVISALLGLGAFADPSAPGWSKVVVGIAIALTVVGVALIAVSRVRPGALGAEAR